MNATRSLTAENAKTPTWSGLLHRPETKSRMLGLLLSWVVLVVVYRAHPIVLSFTVASPIIIGIVDAHILSYLPKFLSFPWSRWVIWPVFVFVLMFTFINNTDGQGGSDLLEAVMNKNPFSAFVGSIEEECARIMHNKKGVDQSPDRDKDHFTQDCGDTSDDDPSFTPWPLHIDYQESDFLPYSQHSVALAKGARFSSPVPALGQDPITDLYLYITADFLSSQDGQYQYYAQRCPGKEKYDPETWRLFCTLDEHINDWREYVSIASDPKRQLKWRLKYVTQNHRVGFVQNDWIPFTADLP